MSEEEVYYWWMQSNGFTKVQHLGIGWNVEAAKKVLNAWQRKFVQVRYFLFIIFLQSWKRVFIQRVFIQTEKFILNLFPVFSGSSDTHHDSLLGKLNRLNFSLYCFQVVNELSEPVHTKQNIMAFSTTSFNDLLRKFSSPNQALIIGGYVLMVLFYFSTISK
jgi:hypothetical protein